MELNEKDILKSEQYLLEYGDESIQKYLRSKRYLKRKTETFAVMQLALITLKTGNPEERVKAAYRLLRISCAELGLTLIEREWYFDKSNKIELSNICINESNDKILEYLLAALSRMYERYIIHDIWKETYNLYSSEIEKEYMLWIFSIAKQITNQSIIVRMALAEIFAICHDKRAWDIYMEILPRRSAATERVWDVCRTYGKYSMTEEQRIGLIEVFKNLKKKVKGAEHSSSMGIKALQSLKLD